MNNNTKIIKITAMKVSMIQLIKLQKTNTHNQTNRLHTASTALHLSREIHLSLIKILPKQDLSLTTSQEKTLKTVPMLHFAKREAQLSVS